MNDVTAGGITSVTKPKRGVAQCSRAPLRDIHEEEDRIAYARDKRVGLSVINQFAPTRRQHGNYGSPFCREL